MTNDKSVKLPSEVVIEEKSRAFDAYFKVDRMTIRHKLYSGGWSPPLMREVLTRGHAVAVLPYDPVREELVFVEQFRIAAMVAFDQPTSQVRAEDSPGGAWLLECIAGIVEEGEEPAEVARRESLEEAGCVVEDLIHARSFLTSPGCLTESVAFYCGRTDASDIGGIHGVADEGEDIRVVRLSVGEAFARLDRGGINNAFTLVALEWFRNRHDTLRARWTA